MKKISLMFGFILAVCSLTPVHAQQNVQLPGPAQSLLQSWNDVGRRLIAMAEDFPEDKYEFKPTPAQRSFAEQLLHAAGANFVFVSAVAGTKPAAMEDPKRDQYKTKAAVVAFVKKSFADGAKAITAVGDKGMNNLVTDPYSNQKVRLGEMAWGLLEHSGEHYGQLVVYYRISGLVPPESRPRK